MPAPIPPDEAARLEELRRFRILDTDAEAEYDDLVHLASQICGTPIALISLIDAHRQFFKSRIGLAVSETPRDVAFCAHAILRKETMVVPDATADARFADNPLVMSDPNIRFYAGAPLVTPRGHSMGTLCVIDRVPRTLSEAQRMALEALSRQAVALLLLRVSRDEAERASRAKSELLARLQTAERQRSQTLAFLSHDIRSPLFSLLAAASNARARQPREPVKALAGEVERYAGRALDLAERFLWLVRAESGEEVRREEVNLIDVCEDSIGNCLATAQAKAIELVRDFETDYAPVLGDVQLLERAVINLVDNAIKYSPEGSRVRLAIARADGAFECSVEDSGPGIPEEGRDKIFVGFSRLAQDAPGQSGAGVGLAIVKAVAEKHNGTVSVESTLGRGSRFTLRLPEMQVSEQDS